MDHQNLSAPSCAQVSPGRRLVAAGFIRRTPDRNLTLRVTEAGVTGRITPATSGGPSCCGRPMTRDGSQYVCGRCGAWTDPGTTGRATRADVYMAAATADHLARCAHCREQAAEAETRHAENSASIARRDRIQLGLARAAQSAQAVNGR